MGTVNVVDGGFMEKRGIAGLMLIMGGVFSVINIIIAFIDIWAIGTPDNSLEQAIVNELYIIAGLNIVFTVIIFAGAFSCFSAYSWGFSIAAAIICLLSVGFLFLSSVFGLVALIMLALGKEEFVPVIEYVDEFGRPYPAQQGQYYGNEPFTDQYYDDGAQYYDDAAYEQAAGYQEAQPIQLVDQYGGTEDHQYDPAQQRYG
jgi:hypothetical protein